MNTVTTTPVRVLGLRWLAIGMAIACTGGAACVADAPPRGEAVPSPRPAPAAEVAPPASQSIGTADYTLAMTVHSGLVPPADRPRAGGSLAAFGDGFLLVTADGAFHRLSWGVDDSLRADPVPVSAPFNRRELLDAEGPDAASPFRITGLAVDDRGGVPRVYLAHHYWNRKANCVTLRVSATVLPAAGSSAPPDPWKTLFDSYPCLAIGTMWPMSEESDRSGGRLVRYDGGLLLSVGDHGFDGLEGVAALPQRAGVSYGKILQLDVKGGVAPFSVGHRNPQGLTVGDSRRVWSTEHGPEGGDELNVIVRGGNYGWPLVSYGRAAGRDVWPHSPDARDHRLFREPAFAFVPSVGISELLQVQADYLPRWSGDLLVGSLQAGILFRVRTRGDRVVFAEHVNLSMRIRDLAEGVDGRLLIWNDAGQIASLARAP